MFYVCCHRAYQSLLFVFFFKQKTAYEMRISDWSSDVCSSDLAPGGDAPIARGAAGAVGVAGECEAARQIVEHLGQRQETISTILVDRAHRHRLDQREIEAFTPAIVEHRRDFVLVESLQRNHVDLDREAGGARGGDPRQHE